MSDISSEVQKQVARIREMIAATTAIMPGVRSSFMVYDVAIAMAEKAVREQDEATLCGILPILREMD